MSLGAGPAFFAAFAPAAGAGLGGTRPSGRGTRDRRRPAPPHHPLDRCEQVAKRVALGEVGVMTVGALLIVTLALRAYQTGG
jgi:hypothetical protein